MTENFFDLRRQHVTKQILILMWVMVLAIVVAFFFFASSICITLTVSIFLAVLLEPIISFLQRWHLPRSLSSGLILSVGMVLIGFLLYVSYNKGVVFAEKAPQFTTRIREILRPFAQKIEKVQETAGNLNPEPQTAKRVAEVKIRETATWPSYFIRGFGSIGGAVFIIGVIPFLTFFLLVRKEQMYMRLDGMLGRVIDVPLFVKRQGTMVRGFVLGNLLIGSILAAITVGVLLGLGVQGAVTLGIVSGFLNLIPFLGVVLAVLLPGLAALLQFDTPGPVLLVSLTVILLHLLAANLLTPKLIGARVSISPVAATVGILFWGWLWGIVGLLLAVPLTAFIKIAADSHPSLIHISNLLADTPRALPRWAEVSERTLREAGPYFRKRLWSKSGD